MGNQVGEGFPPPTAGPPPSRVGEGLPSPWPRLPSIKGGAGLPLLAHKYLSSKTLDWRHHLLLLPPPPRVALAADLGCPKP